jgi:hypothetical protein
MTNMLEIKTSSNTLLKRSSKSVDRLEVSSPVNFRRASLSGKYKTCFELTNEDDKFNTVPHARLPSHRRAQSISLVRDASKIEISEPFNFRKNSVDFGVNSIDISNSSFVSRTTDPLPRRYSKDQTDDPTDNVKISQPFNLQYQFGLKPKNNPASSHTL